VARKAGPVGRDDVLAELRRVVDEAVAGRGHLLLLAGEARIGKTTMLTAAAGFAESRGVRVAWGWGCEYAYDQLPAAAGGRARLLGDQSERAGRRSLRASATSLADSSPYIRRWPATCGRA
jgi:hypothetical protein